MNLQQTTKQALCLRADVLHAEAGIVMAFGDAMAALRYQISLNEQLALSESLAQIPGLKAAIAVIADLVPLANEIAKETIGGQNVR